MTIAKADGSYLKLMEQVSKLSLLVLDDWGIAPMTDTNRRDLLEIIDDRYNHSSTLITSQLPVGTWYDSIGDATLGDAISDRLVHNAHRIEVSGPSMRKNKAKNLSKESQLTDNKNPRRFAPTDPLRLELVIQMLRNQ